MLGYHVLRGCFQGHALLGPSGEDGDVFPWTRVTVREVGLLFGTFQAVPITVGVGAGVSRGGPK